MKARKSNQKDRNAARRTTRDAVLDGVVGKGSPPKTEAEQDRN